MEGYIAVGGPTGPHRRHEPTWPAYTTLDAEKPALQFLHLNIAELDGACHVLE